MATTECIYSGGGGVQPMYVSLAIITAPTDNKSSYYAVDGRNAGFPIQYSKVELIYKSSGVTNVYYCLGDENYLSMTVNTEYDISGAKDSYVRFYFTGASSSDIVLKFS